MSGSSFSIQSSATGYSLSMFFCLSAESGSSRHGSARRPAQGRRWRRAKRGRSEAEPLELVEHAGKIKQAEAESFRTACDSFPRANAGDRQRRASTRGPSRTLSRTPTKQADPSYLFPSHHTPTRPLHTHGRPHPHAHAHARPHAHAHARPRAHAQARARPPSRSRSSTRTPALALTRTPAPALTRARGPTTPPAPPRASRRASVWALVRACHPTTPSAAPC
jgi:hypothetical protein